MPYSIAIAGCGVAGLTAAILLARQGHRVTLFEQSAHVGPLGAGILLQPSGQLVLQEMGLLERIAASAERIDRLHAITHRGHTLIDLPYSAVALGMHAYGLHRGDLFMLLHAELVTAGVVLQLCSRIVRFAESASDVELFDAQDASRGRFDCLLAADGARSQLRHASALPASVFEYPHGVLWALGSCPAIAHKLYQVTRGTSLLCGLLPMGLNRCSFFWSLEKRHQDALFARDFSAWKNEVIAFIPESESIVSPLRSFEDLRYTTYLHVRMPRWHTSRFLLLGDAAHAMSPHLGQGINLALLDGFTLAHAFATAGSIPDAFTLYSHLRRAHIRYYAAVTYFLSPFFQSRGVVKGWGRDFFLPLIPHLPLAGPQTLLTMTGLKRSYFGGMLRLPI